jgi:hypothetical protein
MKIRNSVLRATAIALALATLPAIADETTTRTTTTTVSKHHYVYYGDHDIYFAPETKTYYWREGNDWRSGNDLPVESRTYIKTGGVNVDLDTERPYEKHEWVVEHYKKHDH